MNRCQPTPWSRLRAGLLATLAFTALAASAQTVTVPTDSLHRQFPESARRGVLIVKNPPEVLMDGKPARLSPGSRIRGTNNLIVPATQLIGQTLFVNYTRELQGMVHDVWILTPEEESQQRAGNRDPVIRNYQFASDPSSQP